VVWLGLRGGGKDMSKVEPTKKEKDPLETRMDDLIGILRDEGREKQQKLSDAKTTPQMETCMLVFTNVFFTVNGKIKLEKIPNKNDEAVIVISKDKKAKACIEKLTKPGDVVRAMYKEVTWMGSNWLLGAKPPKDTAMDNDFTSQSQNWSDFLHLSYGVRTVFLKKEKKWNIDAILKDLEELADKQAGFGKKVKNRAQELAKKERRDNKPVNVDFFLAYEIETHEGINQAALDPLNDMIATIAGVKLYEDITKNKVKITTVKGKIVVDLEHYLEQGWKEFRKKSPKYLMELKGKFEKMIKSEELPKPPGNRPKKYQVWKNTLGNILKKDKEKIKNMNEDKRDELEKQKEKIDADIVKLKADEEELRAKRREAQIKCDDEKNRLKKALRSVGAKVESEGPEGYAAQRLEIKAVKDEEIQLGVKREREKTKFRKKASDLKKKRKAAEKKAKKKEKEIEKLSGKFEKYENETQASAIMTTLSMTFISLCQWLLSTYFKWDKIGLETLIEKIFRLPGRYVDSSTERIIYLDCQNKNRNKHEQEFNRMMERACEELSRSNIKLNDGRLLRMKYVTPP
jgi:hypothetical protein